MTLLEAVQKTVSDIFELSLLIIYLFILACSVSFLFYFIASGMWLIVNHWVSAVAIFILSMILINMRRLNK